VNSPLSVTGNMTLGSGGISGSGALTIGGHSSAWTGGQIDLGSPRRRLRAGVAIH
jgi:hypothetical protein